MLASIVEKRKKEEEELIRAAELVHAKRKKFKEVNMMQLLPLCHAF